MTSRRHRISFLILISVIFQQTGAPDFVRGQVAAFADNAGATTFNDEPFEIKIDQLTFGEKHHFFGYIGHCKTIPWSSDGRFILGLEIDRIDRMPDGQTAATIILVDTFNQNKILRIEKTNAWNPQQGTMFYWNPLAPDRQFFFNDRDVRTGQVYVVLFDIKQNKRVKEFRFADTPIGNSGVAVDGSAFLGLNYGRLARLRAVTGYPDADDWSREELSPQNDGIFIVNPVSGEKKLLVSYLQLESLLKDNGRYGKHTGLFINHTLWNRDSNRIYFFIRAGWSGNGGKKINVPCSIDVDGSNLRIQTTIGGHPEWAEGTLMIGGEAGRQVLYDADSQKVVGQLGTPEIFPDPVGDVALSPNGNLFVNGYKVESRTNGNKNFYAFFRRSDGFHLRSPGIDRGDYEKNIRIDPAPRWNRNGDAILVPGIAENKTRQMFVIRLIPVKDD